MGQRSTRALFWLLTAAVLTVYAILSFDWSSPPAEDAAMLMRYARHLGHGHGMVWNIGQEPVDGATDFLLTVLLGSLVFMDLSVTTATRLVTITAHIAILCLLAVVLHRQRAPTWLNISVVSFLAIGGGLAYAEAYFGTSVFALCALVSWLSALELRRNPSDLPTAVVFGLSALATGLARPEGVILCFLMWLALLWWFRFDLSRVGRMTAIYFMIMLLFGGAYFFWRWDYFGSPLPNPFYVKGGGLIYPSSLVISFGNLLSMTLPLLPLLILSSRAAGSRRELTFLAIPVVGFTSLWILMTNEMNYLMRFQYAAVPLVLVSWYPIFHRATVGRMADTSSRLHRLRGGRPELVYGALLLYLFGAMVFQDHLFARRASRHDDGRGEVGTALRVLADRGYYLATAEAGLLPFNSRWPTIDLWGLNDKRIARQGLDHQYLDELRPAVLMYHANKSPLDPVQRPTNRPYARRWAEMIDKLDAYVESRPYRLAAAFGVQPNEAHYYFVRADLPDSETLLRTIAETRYPWPSTGEVARDLSRPVVKDPHD